MSRPVILSNGSMAVGLNEDGLVQDFYYPYVGLDNLTNARLGCHKIGLWVDGQFSWIDRSSWSISVDIDENALISIVSMYNKHLQISLQMNDVVDHQKNVFARSIQIHNQAEHSREIRLFMH